MEVSFSLPILALFLASAVTANTNTSCSESKSTVYDIQFKNLYGKPVKWNEYKHKVILVVNVATY